MTNLQLLLEELTKNISHLAADHGMTLVKKYVGSVKVGDYLLYTVTEHEQNPDREEGVWYAVERTYCRRVVATGGEQGSGPRPGQNWLAMEGDDRIRQYGDRRNDDTVIVFEVDENRKGLPEGGLRHLTGEG